MIDWNRHPMINRCASLISQGGVVAYPTEAVWALGCDPFNEASVRLLCHFKNRDIRKGLILIASSIRQIEPLIVALPSEQQQQLRETWPGAVTWVLPNHKNWVPPWITGEHKTVAVRVTAHPVACALSQQFGGPLVSTSANIQKRRPAKNRLDVQRVFGEKLDFITPGHIGSHTNVSEIRDLNSGRIVRAG